MKLSTDYGMAYIGDINIGSNNEPLKAIFDTGSSFIWFGNSTCQTCKYEAAIKNTFDCE